MGKGTLRWLCAVEVAESLFLFKKIQNSCAHLAHNQKKVMYWSAIL